MKLFIVIIICSRLGNCENLVVSFSHFMSFTLQTKKENYIKTVSGLSFLSVSEF